MPKKKHSPQRKSGGAVPRQLTHLPASSPRILEECGEAERLMQRKRWAEARELLEALDRRYPDRPEVMMLLPTVYDHLHDSLGYEDVSRRLLKFLPENA